MILPTAIVRLDYTLLMKTTTPLLGIPIKGSLCFISERLHGDVTMFGFISKNIITGLVTILPVVLTLYLLYWFAVSVESLLGSLIQAILPEEWYWPGMGLAAGLLVFFLLQD